MYRIFKKLIGIQLHVIDLAYGHVKAIDYLNASKDMGKPLIVNLGTGKGYSKC